MEPISNIVSILRELRETVDALQQIPDELRADIDEELGKLSTNEFYLVVLGQFKRGKTTFINALLGEEFLPAGILPLTAIVTFIRYGETKRAEVVFNDRHRQQIDVSETRNYISEQENPNNKLSVRYVEVFHPSPFLKNGIVLIDTPGIGSTAVHNTAMAKEFIPHVDAAVVVTAVDPIITQVEYEFLAELRETVRRFFFILNKVDTLSEQETKEALLYTQNVLGRALNAEANVYPVSALNALRRRCLPEEHSRRNVNDGLDKVEADIARYLHTDKAKDFAESSKRRVKQLLDNARFHVELSEKAIETPLLDLQKKIGLFHQFIDEIAQEQSRYSHIMNGEIAELKRWIGGEAEARQMKETSLLKKKLPQWLSSDVMNEDASKKMQRLENIVLKNLVDDTEQWRRSLQSNVVQRYDAIVSTSIHVMNSYVERIVQHSASLFSISVEPFAGAEKISSTMNFSYKVHDDPLFLEIDAVKIALRILPRSFARLANRLIEKRIEKIIEEKVRLNCGRVQADFVGKIDEHFRQFGYQFSETVEKTTGAINTILAQAVKQKSSDDFLQAETRRRYHDQLATLSRLKTQLMD
jgi:GTPase SAR1 family protein